MRFSSLRIGALALALAALAGPSSYAQSSVKKAPSFANILPRCIGGRSCIRISMVRDRHARDYRTRIREGMRGGANFAGNMALIEIGCGTGCKFVYAANAQTGQVMSFPLGGEDNLNLDLRYRPDSRLVVAHWQGDDRCIRQSYIFTGSSFRQVDVADVGKAEDCFSIAER